MADLGEQENEVQHHGADLWRGLVLVALGVGCVFGSSAIPAAADSPVEPVLIVAEDNGPAKDVVMMQVAESAAGEEVRLLVIRGTKEQGNKRLVVVRKRTVTAASSLTFNLADRNGDRKTRYVAKITVDSLTYTSNTQKPR